MWEGHVQDEAEGLAHGGGEGVGSAASVGGALAPPVEGLSPSPAPVLPLPPPVEENFEGDLTGPFWHMFILIGEWMHPDSGEGDPMQVETDPFFSTPLGAPSPARVRYALAFAKDAARGGPHHASAPAA